VDALTYKVVVTTGNTNSHGMTLYEFSDLIASLGVQTAYNLDGGDSAIMVLGGKKVNEPELDNIRNLYDIIYFASAWEGEGK
jgi:exopolysaccharide biosynthesis protein